MSGVPGMLSDVARLAPEAVLLAGALTVLVLGSFTPRERQWRGRVVTVVVLLTAGGLAAAALRAPAGTAFSGTFAVDAATGAARLVAVVAALLVVVMAGDEVAGHRRESEVYVLVLLSTTGTLLLAGASDLALVAVAFLLASIPLYGLVGVLRRPLSAEAALKTYLLGALSGIVLLLGVVVLSGVAGETVYVRVGPGLSGAPPSIVVAGGVGVLGGLMFKAGGVPAHFWVPDAAQGSAGTVAAFVTTVPKVGALVAAYRLVVLLPDTAGWVGLVGALAVASMTLGNLAALGQDDPRRLLGWSTVSQVGYLLVPVAVAGRSGDALPSLLLYLAGYAVTNVGAFAVTSAHPGRRDLAAWRGLSRSSPVLAGALLVVLLGLVGTPPTAVFVGKLTAGLSAWQGDAGWLTVALLANTVLSLVYYLRWVVPVFRHEPTPRVPDPARSLPGAFVPRRWSAAVAVAGAGLGLVLGVGSGLLWPLVDGVLAR